MNFIHFPQELVVNWHITEACNYKCSYCFAKWQEKDQKELLHSKESTIQLMTEIEKLPTILNQESKLSFQKIRLNLVGGETFLYKPQLLNIVTEAKKRGFQLSAITNGSRLDDELIEVIAKNFDCLGISIDSLNDETNLKIGRADKSIPMDIQGILNKIIKLRQINPYIDIKINTVVSHLNAQENFHSLIDAIQPSKWKIFQMLPILTDQYQIDESKFHNFLARHQDFTHIISSENNDEMIHSYLMIDPLGRFFQNSNTSLKPYHYSRKIIDYGIAQALNDIDFNINKFFHRYKLINTLSI